MRTSTASICRKPTPGCGRIDSEVNTPKCLREASMRCSLIPCFLATSAPNWVVTQLQEVFLKYL